MTPKIRYTITPHHPEAHIFRVTCTVDEPDPGGQIFRLPTWIPGSYMIREFARNIVSIKAESGRRAVRMSKLDKNTWQAAAQARGRALTVSYDVYAWDLSVRAAHLDQTHGFFNGTSVFLWVEGQTDQPCLVDIHRPEGEQYHEWQVATTLASAHGEDRAAPLLGFGVYRAENYDELVDHPVEMGNFTHAGFELEDVRYELALTGRHDCDTNRLCADLRKICAWQIKLFGKPAPMDRYLFLATVVGQGYGGLEHRTSTALMASRKDLPYHGMRGLPEGYRKFLGLCSHEHFHTWNVKRIKPAAFTPYDYTHENYTRLLWAFEGFTAYYDDLTLVRSGVISTGDYLQLLGQTLTGVLRGTGRFKQSVAESSFDAWTKFYRQDENAPNAIVSYYAKGSLIALALDLQLRTLSRGRRSLDDVMRLLWKRYGQKGVGVEEDGIYRAVQEVAAYVTEEEAQRLVEWLRRAVTGTADLPLPRLLRPFGVNCRAEPASRAPALGVRLVSDCTEARLATVYDSAPAQTAGLSAGDVLIAIDGLKVDAASLSEMLGRRKPGDVLTIHAFRRDELMTFDVELASPPLSEMKLSLQDKPQPSIRTLRKGWLGV